MSVSDNQTEQNHEHPILNIVGEKVAFGPLRKDLLSLYQRWQNDFATMHTLERAPQPRTHEEVVTWYEERAKASEDPIFTIYEHATLRPVDCTWLHNVDHRNRSAGFGIAIGELDRPSKGYGTETTRLILGYAFTVFGLHNVMLTVFEYNPAEARTQILISKRKSYLILRNGRLYVSRLKGLESYAQ